MKFEFKKYHIQNLLEDYYGWYGNIDKDLYKYCVGQLLQTVDYDVYKELNENQKENLYDQLISLIHNIQKGGSTYEIQI